MAGIGFLDYAYKMVTGEIAPPIAPEGTGPTMDTINKFSDKLQNESQKAWQSVSDSLLSMASTSVFGGKGTYFSKNFVDDLRKVVATTEPGAERDTAVGRLFEYSYEKNGAKYIYSESADPERQKLVQKQLDDLHNVTHWADNAQYISDLTVYTKGTFIDPHTFYGKPEDVPHTEELTFEHISYETVVKSSNFVQKIMEFVKNNPDKFNVATVTKAFRDETDFMNKVNEKWNDSSVNKSIREGDALGTFENLLGEGLVVAKDGIVTVGDATLGSDISPIKPFWDLFKNLWENAGTYLEYVAIAAVVLVLLWVAGEVKTITRE